MATFYELPLANDFPYFVVNSSGASVPASGYQLFLYSTGSSTKITSYTDSTGGTPNANPVLLGSTGLPQSGSNVVGIWLSQGQTVKAVFTSSTDTDPPTSPIWTRDFGANPPGINDPTNITASSEWVQGTTPTFISTTSFSVTGDQRTNYQVGRRVKTVNSGGTVYSRISASSFGSSITTVTVQNDSGVLDSGLSSVSYGILSATNSSVPDLPKVIISTAVGKIVPGATSLSLRNSADNADNLLVADAGAATFRASVGLGATTPSGGGTGVAFPATQSASSDVNTLDDYEEGTWIPSVGGNASYAAQTGTYTKIGRAVFFEGLLTIGTIGTGSTTVISGLPFTCSSTSFPLLVAETVSLASSVVSISGRINGGGTTITILSKTAAATGDSTNAAFGNSTFMRFGGYYEIS